MELGPATKLNKRNKQKKTKTKLTCHVGELLLHCRFFSLWSIWSNLEGKFQMHGL